MKTQHEVTLVDVDNAIMKLAKLGQKITIKAIAEEIHCSVEIFQLKIFSDGEREFCFANIELFRRYIYEFLKNMNFGVDTPRITGEIIE